MARIDWDHQPLGQMPDMELARRLGVSHQAVWLQRTRRRIAAFVVGTGIDWDAQPLGKLSDGELAARLGCSIPAVYNARLRRKIPSTKGMRAPTSSVLTRDRLELLHLRYGMSGYEIAAMLGVDNALVGRRLRALGIARSHKEAMASPRTSLRIRQAIERRRSPEAREAAIRKLLEEAAE